MKILAKQLKKAGFDLRKDHKKFVKKTKMSKKYRPKESDQLKLEEEFGAEIEKRRLARLERRAKKEALIPEDERQEFKEMSSSSEDDQQEGQEDGDEDVLDLDIDEEVLVAPTQTTIEDLTKVDERYKEQHKGKKSSGKKETK